mmetsp:Transcript_34472/g.89841  ORF Transcript_34472/g.89841 Transcript_34472/m.89841 type:complete len:203 (-) Transcript_34472:13-621(-)
MTLWAMSSSSAGSASRRVPVSRVQRWPADSGVNSRTTSSWAQHLMLPATCTTSLKLNTTSIPSSATPVEPGLGRIASSRGTSASQVVNENSTSAGMLAPVASRKAVASTDTTYVVRVVSERSRLMDTSESEMVTLREPPGKVSSSPGACIVICPSPACTGSENTNENSLAGSTPVLPELGRVWTTSGARLEVENVRFTLFAR